MKEKNHEYQHIMIEGGYKTDLLKLNSSQSQLLEYLIQKDYLSKDILVKEINDTVFTTL